MTIHPAMALITQAMHQGYAVGYFESWSLDSFQGVIDAAEETRSPILIGVNGAFLSREGRLAEECLSWYAALGRAAAASAAVPCGLIFNECGNDAWLRAAVDLGFSLVMPDDPEAEPAAFMQRVAALTRYAHQHGVAVEAEVGHLPCGVSETMGTQEGGLTDPLEAARFVKATAIDLLAISVGNVHILLSGSRALDLDHLARVRRAVELPFDLHGGTGIAPDSLREAIGLGVAKVCYGTYIKQRYLREIRKTLGEAEPNPHKVLGFGGPEDLLVAGRRAVKEAVLERIEGLGCCGKA